MQQGLGPHASAPMPGVRICPGCGIIAPLARTSCNVCSAPFGPQPTVAAGRAGAAVLACIHAADFTCKACGIRSPLATVDAHGEAECMGCGLRQAFDVVQWTDALGFAHGVGDLSGPSLDPIGARSRHAKIGVELTSSTKTQNAMIMDGQGTRTHSLRTSVSPGHPVCKTCHVPLDVWLEGETTKTRCARCNDAASYGLPPNARGAYPALVGVLSNEQRTDRAVARLGRTQAGVESIVCPQCGAGLGAGGGSELAKCTYCGLAVRIPGTLARQQRRGAPPKMDPFWVLLDGPSPARQRLARGKSEDADDDDDDEEQRVLALVPPVHGAPPAWGHAPMPPKASGATKLAIVFAILGLFLLGGTAAGIAVWMNMEEDEPPPPAAPPRARGRK
ncbi:MAG: hypothetical protein KF819_31665 [Labilithrix sp.]|nr:hypothetical protein [Labilithrix sp.]